MYTFIDTTEIGSNTQPLPAEALSINGTYIENVIDGYRTLHATGRELLESEITDLQIGQSDGTQYQGKRNPPREIVVTYVMFSSSAEDFRDKYNKLCGIIDQEEAKLVFADEPDKYFIGTKSHISEPDGGHLNATGSFTFYCTDPYKHSTVEKTFPASVNSDGIMETTIVNNGTAPVPISYEITNNHENGYIGIASEYGAMQYGYVDELDKEIRQKSETLINYQKATDFNAMTDGQGILTENFPKNGTWATFYNYLALGNAGSGTSWHGASKMIILPADSFGEVGAHNFLAQTQIWFETGKVPQTGLLEFVIGDENGQHLASIHVMKNATTVNDARAIMQIQLNEKFRYQFEPNYKSVTSEGKGQMYIRKTGDQFEFLFGGVKHQVRVPGLNKKAKSLTIFLGQYGSRGTGTLVNRMYFKNMVFRKDNVNYIFDIPNRYKKGDEIYIDGEASKIYKNGVYVGNDEMVGTKYFKAPPGETKVQFYYSDFSVPTPTIEARIREAWL